jgi:hypothetical protein
MQSVASDSTVITATTVRDILTRIIEGGDGDAPAFIELNGSILPLTSVAQGMEAKRVTFVARTQ